MEKKTCYFKGATETDSITTKLVKGENNDGKIFKNGHEEPRGKMGTKMQTY